VARGVGRGIEAASKVLMPLLAVLMAALAAPRWKRSGWVLLDRRRFRRDDHLRGVRWKGDQPAPGRGLVGARRHRDLAAAGFFVLLFVAALASAVSMLELAVALLRAMLRWVTPALIVAASLAPAFLGQG
jgi:SNF family Na+-dependent transporter